MSFIRHEEIYPCDEGGYGEGAVPQDHALAHRNDESPAGYSSAGCSPAAPASASPAAAIILWLIFSTKFFAANGKLSPIPLSQLKGAVLCPVPGFPGELPGVVRCVFECALINCSTTDSFPHRCKVFNLIDDYPPEYDFLP